MIGIHGICSASIIKRTASSPYKFQLNEPEGLLHPGRMGMAARWARETARLVGSAILATFDGLFKERPIYEQSVVRTPREQRQKRPSECARQPF
jgi:hypothetical protein